jgi:predicted ATPase
LPAELSSLVGRDLEIAAVRERLRGGRVVTLTGPGGCGKTRLALRVAALAAGGFEDGAWLVELASLADAALVPASVAEALGVPERDAADPLAGVVRALAGREVLIVLDNCEHVLGTAGQVVVLLAGQCPRVRILATSRERLDVPGELVFPVPPLGLPEDGSAGAVAASEAGTLFVAPARAASPVFALTAGDAAAVAEVCARLDGMPLAIELAAARCPALGPVQLAARLEGHPGLLSGGAARPERHRSLEALVSWSYDLLDDAERRLLARLSVLRGGFGLEVAERVAGGEPLAPGAVAGRLASLASKSLVQVQAGPVVRYSLLETVRQFAAGQLAASGEETAVHARLLEWAFLGRSPVSGCGPFGRRAGRLVQPAIRRTGQHPCRVVLGAGRRQAGGGTGLGRPAGPVVDRHRPVQRSGPVPDRGGRRPGRSGSRHPRPGNARRGLVGVPTW